MTGKYEVRLGLVLRRDVPNGLDLREGATRLIAGREQDFVACEWRHDPSCNVLLHSSVTVTIASAIPCGVGSDAIAHSYRAVLDRHWKAAASIQSYQSIAF